jgi:glycogen phosphorylase
VNLLRLWKAEAVRVLRLPGLQRGRLLRGGPREGLAENISKVLYPNDEPEAGKELRLKQQYFFVSCSLQDMIRLQLAPSAPWNASTRSSSPAQRHPPGLAVAELMRLLMDEHGMDWDPAWEITRNTFASPTTPCCRRPWRPGRSPALRALLPRHLEIIYEINRRFLDEVRVRFLGDDARVARMSLIDEDNGRRVRMAISPPSAATPSTGWRSCTASCSSPP